MKTHFTAADMERLTVLLADVIAAHAEMYKAYHETMETVRAALMSAAEKVGKHDETVALKAIDELNAMKRIYVHLDVLPTSVRKPS